MKLLRLVFLLLFIDYGSTQEMPANASLDLVDGCPYELSATTCQRLQMDGINAVCPHKLWLSHTEHIFHEATQTLQYSTSWIEIQRLYLDSNKKYNCVNQAGAPSRMYIESKVACSPSIPTHTVHSRLQFHNKEDSEVPIYAPGSLCGRGHTVARNDGQEKKYCICPYGWGGGPKKQCDDPIDPFGIAVTIQKEPKYPTPPAGAVQETCNILRVEGCPDEEMDGCVKLRFMSREPYFHGAYCPYKLWLSTESEWDAVDSLTCNWHTKEWMVKRSSRNYKHPMSYNHKWRVQCALSKPTMSHLSFRRVTNVKNEKGELKPSLTHFCFRNWNQTCQNGGHCVHSHRPMEKQQPVLTYCVCPEAFSGEHCEVKKSATDAIADNPICSLLLAESCQPDDWNCEPLRLNKTTQTIDCPWTLWASITKSIHNVYTETNHFTTNWTEIDELRCRNEKWEMIVTRGEARKRQVLSLKRKIMCAKNQPFLDADAFWEHRDFVVNSTNFATVHPSPVAYCPEEHYGVPFDCQYGTCVVAYKNGKFEKACACNFGYQGGNCKWPYDPYGLDLGFSQSDNLVRAPLPGATLDTCNVLVAEGCPVQHMPSESDQAWINCTKLRVFGTGVVCPRTLWVSHPSTPFEEVFEGGKWTRIDSLECRNTRWTFRVGEKEEQLPGDRIVACATEKPWSNSRGFEHRKDGFPVKRGDSRENAMTSIGVYCFNNDPYRCSRTGYCINMHTPDYKQKAFKDRTHCLCFKDVISEDEGQPSFISEYCSMTTFDDCNDIPILCKGRYDLADDGRSRPGVYPRPRPNEAEDKAKKICDPDRLEDGCTDDNCVKLRANDTHVKCNELLWLNYGGDFFLDWHEVSGVKCVDNQWQSECAKKIGHRKLMCSKNAPSSISSSLYLTMIISAVVIILLIALTCVLCLLRRTNRKVHQAASLARTPRSSRHPSSTAREEDSDEK